MPKTLTLEQTYDKCMMEGALLPQDKADINKIKSMLTIIEEYIKVSEELKNKNSYNVEYDTNYNIIHMLTEAILLFDKIKSSNHQCLFAALCIKHPELELDWNFFEKIRTKRNGMHYYGTAINKQDWNGIEIQTRLYIKTLHAALKKKISEIKS